MPDVVRKTLEDLEWGRVVAAVAARCTGPLRESLELEIEDTIAGARRALGEAAEASALLDAAEGLPLDGIPEVRQHLLRLERQGALDGPQLRDVLGTLRAARTLRRFLADRKKRVPLLWEACSTDPTLDRLEDEIAGALEADGTVSDRASAELRALRTEVANVRARLVARLEELVHKHADVLADRWFTLRDGRYVIPLRRDAHEKIPGIVHGTSASGASVFIEPRALITLGNRLRMATAEMEREEARILALLSDLVRERLHDVRRAAEALDHADVRNAAARLRRDLRATIPALVDGPRMDAREARHPLLMLDGVDVVPNDLAIAGGQALVLSGPNAGGKTVALKTMGLCALMARAGLPVVAREGCEIGFFDPVLTDVGDDQSLAKNLSTFSAHVTNLARILLGAGPHALVLLDELATGTDPHEGAALACAVVDQLCKQGAALAVTTHYEALKAMAFGDPRLRNGSVGFDVTRMMPTFELRLDVPGASSALAVAARFGMPPEVIETARRILPEQARTFDELVRKLDEQHGLTQRAREALDEERREAEKVRAKLDAELAEARARDRKALSREAQRLIDDVKQARDELREARGRIKKEASEKADAQAIAEAKRAVEEAARRAAEAESAAAPGPGERDGRDVPAAEPEPIPEAELRVGTRIWVPRLRAEAEVVEAAAKGRVRIAAGPMKLYVGVDEVRRAAPREPAPAPAAGKPKRGDGEPRREEIRTSDNTLDVRGMRADDAIAATEAFVDRLYGAGAANGFVLHGVGTGALRDAIREMLGRAERYVARVRAGASDEGGDKVTVFYLR